MRRMFLSATAIAAVFMTKAQIVTTTPEFVTDLTKPVVVTFHADQGNAAMAGLTGSTAVYAHTGVILEGSDKWTGAPNWLDNSAKYKLSYAGADTWELRIPSIKEFYGLSSTDHVSRLAFVFRDATGSKEGKTVTNGDIFVSVFPAGFDRHSTEKPHVGAPPKMGPTANADGSVTFVIAAPGKEQAMIVGSWNDFALTEAQVMDYEDVDGQRYFMTTVADVADGRDHRYFFLFDNSQAVGDPYARLVLDGDNDKHISSTTFADMPPYPSTAVMGAPVAVYNSSMADYDWEIDDFKGADQSQLVIYELLVRDFSGTEGKANGEGTLAGVMSKLDYLESLGINAVELLPIMEFNGNNSWGYNTNFYFAPDKFYGTPDAYKKLIDELHKRGIAVILDIVFNQTDGQHPWYQLYPTAQNQFYNGSAPHAYSVLNDWNQDNPLVQQQFKDALKFWLTEYKVDGFRFDLVKGLGANSSYGATYDAKTNTWSGVTDAKTNDYNASRVARMAELHSAMKEVAPDAYFINENLAGAKEENEMAEDGESNWANVNNASCQFAMGYQSDSNLNRFYAPLDSRTWGSTVSYAESHDEERMAYKINKYGARGVKGDTRMATRRLGSVAAQMLMTPGAHMIWQFQEFGADESTKNASGGNDTSAKRVVWSYLDDPDRHGLMENYRQLNGIRNNNREMFGKDAATSVDCSASSWSRGRSITLRLGDKALFVVVNPNVSSSITISLNDAPADSDLNLLSSSYATSPSLSSGKVTLEPGAYAVYGTKDLVDADEVMIDEPTAQGVEIYDLTGRRLSADDTLAAGIYIEKRGASTRKIISR